MLLESLFWVMVSRDLLELPWKIDPLSLLHCTYSLCPYALPLDTSIGHVSEAAASQVSLH